MSTLREQLASWVCAARAALSHLLCMSLNLERNAKEEFQGAASIATRAAMGILVDLKSSSIPGRIQRVKGSASTVV